MAPAGALEVTWLAWRLACAVAVPNQGARVNGTNAPRSVRGVGKQRDMSD
jgi:hypothetical protein